MILRRAIRSGICVEFSSCVFVIKLVEVITFIVTTASDRHAENEEPCCRIYCFIFPMGGGG